MTTTAMKKMSKSATSKATAKATGSSEKLRKAAIAEIGERIAKLDGAQAPASEAGASQATTATTVATDAKAARGGKAKAKRAPDATDATDAKPAKSAKPAKEAKVKRLSALDAAAIILKNAKQPMNSDALIVAMAERKLWTSPNGQTPSQTLYAALGREINSKGKQSRFVKVERGLFAANPKMA